MRPSLLKLAALGLLLLLNTPSYAGLREDGAACDAKEPHPELAIPACTRLIAANPRGRDLAITYYNRALAWHNKGDLAKAKSDYDQSIAINPSFAPSYGQRAKVYLQNQDYDRALSDFDQAIRLKPAGPFSAGWFNNRAELFVATGDYDRALADYGKSIELDPNSWYAYVNRALVYDFSGKDRLAALHCQDAIKLAPRAAGPYYCRAVVEISAGDLDHAARDIERAIGIQDGQAEFYSLRGLTLASKGELDQAMRDYDHATQLNAQGALNYARRGLADEKKGDIDAARTDFRHALDVIGLDQLDRTQGQRIAREGLQRLDQVATTEKSVVADHVATKPDTVKPAPALAAAVPLAPIGAGPKATTTERRIALVVGNSKYRSVPVLPNPGQDAAAIADTLRAVGFQDVRLVTDATRDSLVEALKSFASAADGADWAVIYYAGHGMEMAGENYLVPVDAKLATDRDVSFEAVALTQVMGATEGARKLHLVILDACRDNPFANQIKRTVASRSIGRGLAQVEPDSGTLVVYAAKHGQVALDGDGGHSPFVTALIRRMQTPRIEIRKLFDLVRDDVMAATDRRQQPFSYGSVPGAEDFYFVSASQNAAK
ncbi:MULTISPECIES: caspase family protein [unclassified Bradyrhizobium]|uniref:caspase family protein n=1 Tax=unclassified Bradyrhizobium TaxID=2631580 RepID=UPI001BACFCE9|nr:MULTISPECIES: caspase family protein [unclassified Bradyrhizobium]MBR1207521.1 tetratricopeptide repeat protein [Bradyrhizobium sp. AUGA SZCCT0124]MBR1315937.1 tetratricopeptide repeat protein [Bradyrhizobium sp. AUGA SZCCT0051]MBR1344043.1 tetratricopeptide repeat protein [Bradyrhizobium sp. AUGA SZCCT0105]MBR1357970.1 tetratricopeptide repeat protein [Bradyrhizobium sp. AUGA SZCCT0045]